MPIYPLMSIEINLYLHSIIKVDPIIYQEFVLLTYSPFRHEVSLLYYSRINIFASFNFGINQSVISNILYLNKHFLFYISWFSAATVKIEPMHN